MVEPMPPWRTRIHPLDLALGALALTVLVYLVVTVPGYRWAGSPRSGLLRRVAVVVTLEITEAPLVRLSAELAPGPFAAETLAGLERLEVLSVAPGPAGSVRVRLKAEAALDRLDRSFWADQPLRRGEVLRFADRERAFRGTIVAIEPGTSNAQAPP